MSGANDEGTGARDPEDPLQLLLALDLPAEGTGARARLREESDAASQGADVEIDESPAAAPVRRVPGARRQVSRARTIAFSATLVALVIAGVGLAYAGVVTVRESTAGKRLDATTDPKAPGFEGFVEPTPVMLLLHQKDGDLQGATVISLNPGEAGGSVVFVPIRTLTDLPKFSVQPLEVGYNGGGAEPAALVMRDLLGVGFTEVAEIDSTRWAELIAPVAPLKIDNPDAVKGVSPGGEITTIFPAGPIELGPTDVGAWLGTTAEDETDLTRLARHQLFWQAWISAIAASGDPAAVPGEGDVGLSHFARALAAGPVEITTLPVQETEDAVDSGGKAFQADTDAVADLIERSVPYPISPEPGRRPRVRLLNGTTRIGLPTEVAPGLVAAGAEIAIVGNAQSFEEEDTTVVYYDRAQAAAAKRLQKELGVGKVALKRRPNDAVDVTIVLGSDYLEDAGLSPGTTVTTSG